MNPLINLSHLKFFYDAVVYGSVSESARMNFVTQSAVSQAISKLEKILGIQIAQHGHQKFQVTEEGMILFEQARHIFKTIKDTFEKIHQTHETVKGSIQFITTNSLGMAFLAPHYQTIKQNLPELDFRFTFGGLNVIRNALKQELVEFAIVVYDTNFSQFAKHVIKKGRFHLYQHVKAPRHQIEQGILVDSELELQVKELLKYSQTLKKPFTILDQVASWDVVARFTELNIGVGFFPDYLVAANRYPTLKVHPQSIPPMEYEICAIHNKDSKLSHAALAFIEQFRHEH
jgi:DNA-binding transcriptional LysR family regulator